METEYIYSEIHITCYNKTHVIQESLSSNAEFRPEKNNEKPLLPPAWTEVFPTLCIVSHVKREDVVTYQLVSLGLYSTDMLCYRCL